MTSMKYICPKRCTANDRGGLCKRCGRSMKRFGRINVEQAQKKLQEETFGNTHKQR